VIEYRDYELIKNVWTPRTTEVEDIARKSRTSLKYDKVDYNLPMKEDEFTLEALRRE
jgi:outer membrane lipoprotein-sorting protein